MKPERATSGELVVAGLHQGCCNTPDADDFVKLPPGIHLAAHGIDTISFAWRPTDDALWELLERAEKLGFLLGFDEDEMQVTDWSDLVERSHRSFLLTNKVCAARWGWWPDHRVIYCEGRLAAMGTPAVPLASSVLGSPADIPSTASFAAFCFYQLLYPKSLPDEVRVRRVDMAADLAFDDPGRGLRFLLGLSAVDVPGLKRTVWSSGPRVETIYYRLPSGKIRFRIYDKAAESKSGEPGSLIRLERQIRWPKAAQLSPEAMLSSDLASLWLGELKPWAAAARNVTIGDVNAAQSAVLAAVSDGRLSPFSAERLLGQLALRARGYGKDWWEQHGKRHITGRRDAELRRIGVVLDDTSGGKSVRLPLGDILLALRDVWHE